VAKERTKPGSTRGGPGSAFKKPDPMTDFIKENKKKKKVKDENKYFDFAGVK
jgi:hypothetical protein